MGGTRVAAGDNGVEAGQPQLSTEQKQAAVQVACAWHHNVEEIRGAERAGIAAARSYLNSLQGTKSLRYVG